MPLELSLQLVTRALPWCGGSWEAELGQLCYRWELTGQEQDPEALFMLLLVLPCTVSSPSPRNVKEMGGERWMSGSSEEFIVRVSAQLHNSFPVMFCCSKQAAVGVIGHVQAVAT